MTGRSKSRQRPGSKRVQGWIYGVINPLIQHLKSEERLLSAPFHKYDDVS